MLARFGDPVTRVCLLLLFLPGVAMAAPPEAHGSVTRQSMDTAASLHAVTFSVRVVADAKGTIPQELQANQDSLSGTVVEIEQQKTTKEPPPSGKEVPPAAKEPPPSVKDEPPSAKEAPPSEKDEPPSAKEPPVSKKDEPPSSKEAPPSEKQVPPSAKEAPTSKKDEPPSLKDEPPSEKQMPSPAKDEPPSVKEVPASTKELPASAKDAPRLNAPESPGSNWDFEQGLSGWTATGDAFTNQPTRGDNVLAERVRTDMMLARGGIGGDYWKRVPYPIGHHLNAWIGTHENHPNAAAPLGAVQGDESTGTLTSGEFVLDGGHRFIAFMVGGGSDVATERVELQVRGDSDADVAEIERIVGGNRAAYSALGALFGGTGGASRIPSRDGNYVIALTASGQNSEVMRPVVFEVPAALSGRRGRIRIVDNSGGSWGHINADDFRFSKARPTDRSPRVWGFADTHSHPVNDLSFGGGVIQGSPYARDGSPYGSDRFRRTALPPLFEKINWEQIGMVASLLTPFLSGGVTAVPGSALLPGIPPIDPVLGAVAGLGLRNATRPARMGYPDMRGYPTFNQMLGEQMYSEWIHRAYDGGLRLMSALAVNNWLLSSHPVKRALLGVSQPEDDKGSADVQVADLKAWALRPENRSWVEVAFTPMDARRIISENKLAMVLGIELDVLGNFVPNNHWTEPGAVVMPDDTHADLQRALIRAELDRLYLQGVRQIGPFHYVNGVWGGCAMFQRIFNEVNRKITGSNVQVVSSGAQGIRYRLDMDSWGLDGIASRTIMTGDGPGRQSDPTWEATRGGHINATGLTQAGEILFAEMAGRGMLIDLDHASSLSTDRLLQLATERGYPVMSSHTDFADLGFTGPGEFSRLAFVDNDAENLRLFETTILGPLRQEGQATRTKVQTIANLGGVSGAILWLPRRLSWGHAVPNDCDGSSKTWAQGYQYAVEMTGSRGVALSTDRITLEPRFGPNAAYLLGLEHDTMPDRDQRRFRQVDAQRNGVRYDIPIKEWRSFRFADAAGSAWSKTPYAGGWEQKSWEHEDAWKAMAAWAAGRNPRTMPNHGDIEPSGDPLHSGRIINYAWGLWSANESELESDCGVGCDSGTLNERYAAYCVKNAITPHELTRWRDAVGIREHFRWVSTVWNEWQRMNGSNDPLRRHVFGNRDFDVNLDGVAHYGMLPDFLQDVANSHPRPAEVGMYLDPLFRSAESYISMWEKARRTAGLHDSDP